MQEALDTDPDFQRTLPSAGVFKAHGQEPLECFSRLAALEASVVTAVPGSTGTRQSTQATPSRRRRHTSQEPERREANSSDFSDLGWLGRN